MNLIHHEQVGIRRGRISRRGFLHRVAGGAVAAGALSFRDLLSLKAEELRREDRAMILLWMSGGPSQLETFDPKPGTPNGGPTEAISTAVPGIQIAQGWTQTAKVMNDICVVRSVTNREGNHERATYQLHTGYLPSGSVAHPHIGCCFAKELADASKDLPAVVSIGSTLGAGFLGVDYEPFVVSRPGSLPENVASPVPQARLARRLQLLQRLERDFQGRGGQIVVDDHTKLYAKAAKLVVSPRLSAFDLEQEKPAVRERYGDSDFGRGCLLARRLVEAGVTFVEVRLGGWDTHDDNFTRTGELVGKVDPAMAALIADLKSNGRLERTLVVWMGEFGRTPKINARTGRDHFPRVFSVALAGGGIRGGKVIGASSNDGSEVVDSPISVENLFCSFCKAMHIDPRTENYSPLGRPMPIVEKGEPVAALFG
jgi:uncharacterized protein (DUF1501 family)